MILYCSIILIAIILLIGANALFSMSVFGFGIGYIAGSVLLTVVGAIAVDGLLAAIIRRLPEKWFAHDKKCFNVSAKEKKFYEKIKIRKWKDRVPELGQFTHFHKNKIADPHSNEYLERYMLEAAYGEAIHLSGVVGGFLVIFFRPLRYWLCFGLPVAIINALMNLPSYAILRYNFYKLKILYASNERRARRAAEEKKVGGEAEKAAEAQA
jgi:glycosyl-4,4'-diaponeurosporenoate acyltransferase